MKIKNIIAGIAIALLFSQSVYAVPVNLRVNGSYINTPAAPVIENNSVLVPVRAVANALGCESVQWDGSSKKVTLAKSSKKIVIQIGSKTAQVNGANKSLLTAAKLYKDRTFVPVRFVAENFGAAVSWTQSTYTVDITGDYVPRQGIEGLDYTQDELEWLAKIVSAEAQGEAMEGKIGVANVILNRLKSPDFPDTIYGVIFDRNYGVQFTPVANGTVYNEPTADSYQAAKQALEGVSMVGECLYFCNPVTSTNDWIPNNRIYSQTIGQHDFYL